MFLIVVFLIKKACMERSKTREKESGLLMIDSGATSHIVNDMSLFNWIDRDHKS